MATITLKPEVYNKAVFFASKDKLNVDDWVNKILLTFVEDSPKVKELLSEPAESQMCSWEELGGIFASDKTDKDLRDEYLKDK